MSLVLGIDCGTQSSKVLVYDAKSREIVASASAAHELIADANGNRAQKASWWIRALHQAMAEIPLTIRQKVKALAVSGQQHGFVPVGEGGEVLHDVKLWNDTSTLAECEEIEAGLAAHGGAARVAGNAIQPGYTAPKVLWLKNHHPDIYRKLKHIMLPHDYLNYYLTGVVATDAGDASGTGYFDIAERCWSELVLSAIDSERNLLSLLPRIMPADGMVGPVLPEVAMSLGLAPGVLVAPGSGDNMMGAIGTGCVRPGDLTLSLGTSGTLYGVANQAVKGQEFFAGFCSATASYLPLMCTMNATAASELMRELFAISLSELEALLASTGPGAGGIMAMPYFDGERSPPLPLAKACFFGLSRGNSSQANMLRAVLESVVFGMRLGLETMREHGVKGLNVRLIGGGSKSLIWTKIVADVLGLKVVCPDQSEAAAMGAALQALWCLQKYLGAKASIADIVDQHVLSQVRLSVDPDPEAEAAYHQVYRSYLEHLKVMQQLYGKSSHQSLPARRS